MSNQLSELRTDLPGTPPVRLVTYATYEEAQAAVDRLSDDGFPVNWVTIVWRGLRQVEQVVGRRTVLTAAGRGAVSGAWFGSMIGLLFALLVDTEDNSAFQFVLAYLLVGALAGAVWAAVGHALLRGRRDFDTVPRLDAEAFELWVTSDLVASASSILGLDEQGSAGPLSTTAPNSERSSTHTATSRQIPGL